jgi:hypothetical protein
MSEGTSKGRPEIRRTVLRVVLADGSEHVVQTLNPDQTLFERTAWKHDWPDPQADKGKGANLWLAFIGWSACKREGIIGDVKFEDFERTVQECLPVADDDGDDGDEKGGVKVPPTDRDTEATS